MEFLIEQLKKLWGKLKNQFFNNRASTVYDTSFNGSNNSGNITFQNGSGNYITYYSGQTTPQFDHDPEYHCYFFKGERVCSACAPDTISKLTKRSLGFMNHFHCDECGKDYHKQYD